jgi:hypothetical protein
VLVLELVGEEIEPSEELRLRHSNRDRDRDRVPWSSVRLRLGFFGSQFH